MGAIFGTKAEAAPAGGGTATSTGSSSGSAAPAQTVDVAAIVDKAAAAKGEKLAWRTSIVDLMKALDIDSSFTAGKELAKELGYTGDSNDSASMNIWLHKQVMAKLAANGGKLPPHTKHKGPQAHRCECPVQSMRPANGGPLTSRIQCDGPRPVPAFWRFGGQNFL